MRVGLVKGEPAGSRHERSPVEFPTQRLRKRLSDGSVLFTGGVGVTTVAGEVCDADHAATLAAGGNTGKPGRNGQYSRALSSKAR